MENSMTESVSGLSEDGSEILAPAGGLTPEGQKTMMTSMTSSNTSESLGRSVTIATIVLLPGCYGNIYIKPFNMAIKSVW